MAAGKISSGKHVHRWDSARKEYGCTGEQGGVEHKDQTKPKGGADIPVQKCLAACTSHPPSANN